jgi:hypothetical protein
LRPLGTVDEPSPLEMAAKGEAVSQLWEMPLKNRVSSQYIVKYSVGSFIRLLDLTLWIQRLLGISIIFMVTPPKPHKSLKPWLDQIDLLWQELVNHVTNFPTSKTASVPFNDWEAQVIYELHLDEFYIDQHQEKISNNFKFAHFSLSRRIQVGNVASSNSLMQG